jgi:hypothetical protein
MKINIPTISAFYINMEDAHQRKDDFISWNRDLGFNNVTRIAGIYDNLYYVGLSKAHVNALKDGISLEEAFIIFEDDAAPTEAYVSQIEVPDDADAVYLGVSPWGFSRDQDPKEEADFNGSVFKKVSKFPGVFKIESTLSTHAILYLNKNYAKAALESYRKAIKLGNYNDVQIYFDGLFNRYNVYAVGPLFYQHDMDKPWVLEGTKNIDMDALNGNS